MFKLLRTMTGLEMADVPLSDDDDDDSDEDDDDEGSKVIIRALRACYSLS